MLMSVDQDEYCDDFHYLPWENALSCPMSESNTDKNKNLKDPGVQMFGGAEVPADGKTVPDRTVVMVVASSKENDSDVQDPRDAYNYHSIVPDVKMVHKDMLKYGQLQNMSTEIETA